MDAKEGRKNSLEAGFRNGAPSSSRTPSNHHDFISRCTASAQPFPECINGLGCKLYRRNTRPFRSVYRWISNSVVRTPVTLRTALRFNGKSRKTGGIDFAPTDSIHFVLLPFVPLLSFFRSFGSKFLSAIAFVSRASFLVRIVGEFLFTFRGETRKEYFFDRTKHVLIKIICSCDFKKSFVHSDTKGCNALIFPREI